MNEVKRARGEERFARRRSEDKGCYALLAFVIFSSDLSGGTTLLLQTRPIPHRENRPGNWQIVGPYSTIVIFLT